VLYGAQAVYDPYMAASFCKAINDWIATEWLARDSRLRASIAIPLQAPDLAIEEIERRAPDNRFVSVLVLAQGESLLGRRHYWPVWQAAEKHRLPIAIHAGSQYRYAPSSVGWPSYRYEYYLAEAQAFQAQVLSLIYEGVFLKFPKLASPGCPPSCGAPTRPGEASASRCPGSSASRLRSCATTFA